MNANVDNKFEQFASSFICAYWSTVKKGVFSESLEKLISFLEHVTERANNLRKNSVN